MPTPERNNARRGLVAALTMIAALGGGMGATSEVPAQGIGETTGKGPNDIARARYRGKLRRAAWRKMHRR